MTCNDHLREQERLASLALYDVLGTPQEETFDRITRLARSRAAACNENGQHAIAEMYRIGPHYDRRTWSIDRSL